MSRHPRALDGELLSIPVELLKPNPRNRNLDNDEDLADLGLSMLKHGCLEPLVVEEAAGGYRIIAGHRRAAAAKLVQIPELPCRLRRGRSDPTTRAALAAIENLQRKQLTPIEEAKALRELIALTGSQAAAARQVGRSPAWLSNRLVLLDLPEDAQQLVAAGQLGAVAAAQLARRSRTGTAGVLGTRRGRPRGYFDRNHRLAAQARRRCNEQEHEAAGRVGGVACGPCWEASILAEDRGSR